MEGGAGKPLNTTEGSADTTIAPHSATNVLTRSNKNTAHKQYTKSVDVRAETMSNTQKRVSELSKLGDASQFQTQRWHGLIWISGSLTVTGILSLISSVIYSSVILVWIGLGLTFWGVLLSTSGHKPMLGPI